ncbi:MAG: GNAT family N-acetyltransferase [Hyphomicrobiales bacterium]|nr:GNAT family N-acetyltransferase [Hyphomicrobiales bacterium]
MANPGPRIPPRADEAAEIDYSQPAIDDFEALSRDRLPVRSMRAEDLNALIAIDRRITGRERRAYYEHKLAETMDETGVRVSLVAEQDGRPVGFIMARVDFGEFGRTDPEAVIDTIGVDPTSTRQAVGTAMMSQLMVNLMALQVERVRTEVVWNNYPLTSFLEHCGFKPAQRLALKRTI